MIITGVLRRHAVTTVVAIALSFAISTSAVAAPPPLPSVPLVASAPLPAAIVSPTPDRRIEGTAAVDDSEVAVALRGISNELKAIRLQIEKPPQQTSTDYIQAIGIAVTLVAAALSAYWASRSAHLLATERGREEKRLFCFELQRQFDAPAMFQCR